MISIPGSPALGDMRPSVHPACFACDPLHPLGLRLRFTPSGERVEATFACDRAYEGYPGLVQGGIVSTLLDSAMTNWLFQRGEVAVTADLHVRFRHPLVLNREATVRAWLARANPPLFVMEAQVTQDAQIKAKAVGKFMRRADANSA